MSYYLEGKSLADIKTILESIAILLPQNKSRWGKQTLSNILSNYHYIGTEDYPTILSKTYVPDCMTGRQIINDSQLPQYLIENNHEAIINELLDMKNKDPSLWS